MTNTYILLEEYYDHDWSDEPHEIYYKGKKIKSVVKLPRKNVRNIIDSYTVTFDDDSHRKMTDSDYLDLFIENDDWDRKPEEGLSRMITTVAFWIGRENYVKAMEILILNDLYDFHFREFLERIHPDDNF